jgi:hypothetical protein
MEKAGILVNNYYPVGALSLCNKNIYSSAVENGYDIVFISDIESSINIPYFLPPSFNTF